MSLTCFYRQYLREVKRLPHNYLRQFFKIKASDDIRSIASTAQHKTSLIKSKVKRVSRDIHRIQHAMRGQPHAFLYILETAYGRRGKLKWELMEPFLTQESESPPEPLIPSVPNSRPPIYSPELKTLLTNGTSREKPLDLGQLKFPPNLSPRADPKSEEARLLGPLSKRLELNTRWRYFHKEWKKVRPPLIVAVRNQEGALSTSTADVLSAGAKMTGFQNTEVFNELERMAGSKTTTRPITRRDRQLTGIETVPDIERHPSRWLRRRYLALLGKIPILVSNVGPKSTKLVVEVALHSGSEYTRMGAHRRSALDPLNLAWLERAEAFDRGMKKSGNR